MDVDKEMRINKVESHIRDILNEYGVRYLAIQLNELYDQYCEIAGICTGGQHDIKWSHEQLVNFLSKNQK